MFTLTAINDTLQELDISWNHIRGKGALAIAIGIQVMSDCFLIVSAVSFVGYIEVALFSRFTVI